MLEPMADSWAQRWDKRQDIEPDEHCDLGWIGEDSEGVFMRVHPQVAFASHPEVWSLMAEWQLGLHRKPSPRDLELSNAEIEALTTLRMAESRERQRRLRARSEDEPT